MVCRRSTTLSQRVFRAFAHEWRMMVASTRLRGDFICFCWFLSTPRRSVNVVCHSDRSPAVPALQLCKFIESDHVSNTSTAQQLCSIKCVPCEGGVPKLSSEDATAQNQQLHGWTVLAGPDRISKSWTAKNFVAAIQFFQQVAELAESEGHHPDLHLVGYRNVTIDIWTHAIDGLSLNDFILAAKIDQLPIDLRA